MQETEEAPHDEVFLDIKTVIVLVKYTMSWGSFVAASELHGLDCILNTKGSRTC